MLVLLAALGIALVALGALILLRFPDRPGGEVRLLGLEVSSVGAGLPLVALGVLVIVLAVSQERNDGQSATSDGSGGGGGSVAGPPPDDAPACLATFFRAPPRVSLQRQRRLLTGVEDVEVLAPEESKREEFGLVLANGDSGKVVGAAKLSYNDEALRFRVDGVVDAGCEPVLWTGSDAPGASPSSLGQHSHLRATLGGRKYDLELKPNSAIVEMELHLLAD